MSRQESMSHLVNESSQALPEVTVYPRCQEHSLDDFRDAYAVRGRLVPQYAPYHVAGGQPAVRFWAAACDGPRPKMGVNLGDVARSDTSNYALPALLHSRHPVSFHRPAIRIRWPGSTQEWSEVVDTPSHFPDELPLVMVAQLVARSVGRFLRIPQQASSPEYTLPNPEFVLDKMYLVELRRFSDNSWQPVLSI